MNTNEVNTVFKNTQKKFNKLSISLVIFATLLIVWNIIMIAYSIINNSFLDPAGELIVVPGGVLVIISLTSSLFGMLNVFTYSQYKPRIKGETQKQKEERLKHNNKYKIFILFNSLAVLSLAFVNLVNQLPFLVAENVLFFMSGCYQYYVWYIKDKEVDDSKFYYIIKNNDKINVLKLLYLVFGLLLVGTIISLFSYLISKQIIDNRVADTSLTENPYIAPENWFIWVKAFVDGFVFTLGFISAMLVAKKSIDSQWLYLVSDTIFIVFWLLMIINSSINFQDEPSASLSTISAGINLILLFAFYMSSNIFNIKNWK